jgi:hypothetical protein
VDGHCQGDCQLLNAEFDTACIRLKVADWVQAINSGSNVHSAGITLRASGVAVWQPGHAVELTSGHRLQNTPIHLSTFPHEGPIVRCNGRPLERGIGLCHYHNSKSTAPSISCCFALSPEHYQETWRQVSTGAFTECSILIDVAPVLHKDYTSIWETEKNSSLYLLGASIVFRRALPMADSIEPQTSAASAASPQWRASAAGC